MQITYKKNIVEVFRSASAVLLNEGGRPDYKAHILLLFACFGKVIMEKGLYSHKRLLLGS